METLAYTYTTQGEIEKQMGVLPVADYTNEVDGTGATVTTNAADRITNAIEYATDVVNQYAYRFYTEAVLAESRYVRRLATFIACFQLTGLKGEPHRYETEYNEAINILKEIHAGRMQIPRLAQRSDFVPAHSNYVIDDRYAKARARVQRETSTGESYTGQNPDITFDPTMPL